jgi:Domain of unknown function (DUF4274)
MALSDEQRRRVDALVNDEWVDEDGDEEASEAAFAKLMRAITDPEELHLFADNFNWDCGCGEMAKVIAHPLCDLGTALLIYWRGRPRWYLKYKDRSEVQEYEVATFDLLQEIERKVLAGDFRTRSLRYDPRNDLGNDNTVEYADIVEEARRTGKLTRAIPSVMSEAISAPGD